MAEPRAWGWDLEEMTSAGEIAEEMEMLEETYHCPPAITGFTPINRLQPCLAPGEATNSCVTHGSKATNKVRDKVVEKPPAKEKKLKRSAPSKAAALKKPRTARTTERFGENDISKNLRRTKPGQEAHDNPTGEKSQVPNGTALLAGGSVGSKLSAILEDQLGEDVEAIFQNQRSNDTNLSMKPRHPGLAERYQAAYQSRITTSVDHSASSQSLQVSFDTAFEASVDFANEPNESVQQVAQGIYEHSVASQAFKPQKSPSPRDFEPPPSAQPPSGTFEEPLDGNVPQNGPSDIHGFTDERLEVEDTFFEDVDALLTNVESLGQTMEEIEVSDVAIRDDEFADDFERWPDDVSMPDAVAIDDEEPQQASDRENEPMETTALQSFGALNHASGNVNRAPQPRPKTSQDQENEFSDPDLDSSLIDLTSPTKIQQPSTPYTSPQKCSSPKLNWLAPKTYTPAKPPSKVPISQTDIPHLVPMNAAGTYLPFVRPPFPKSVLDRSPILGLTNTVVLRTCFRIGEAINAAAQASRSNIDSIIELYARIGISSREANRGFKQSFQFADLFTDKPPYLSGTSTIWKGVGLWDQDSRVFLGEAGRGKMCRAIGRIKRGQVGGGSGGGGMCEMTVLSIWEVDWEDVGVAKGVICS